MSDHECDESYRECVESRKARVAKAIAEAPLGATDKEIAEAAGVHRNTIVAAKRVSLQSAQGCADCNKPAKLPDGWLYDIEDTVERARKAQLQNPQACGDCNKLPDSAASLRSLIDSGRRFGTIYADPPWRYDNIAARGAAEGHYRTMSLDEICALPVRELAAADAHLHLWVVNAVLPDFKRVFDAWGFTFKSSFVWCKPQMGCGNYWRNSHELLLTGVRGNATRFNDQALMSWDTASRYAHSEKPETVRYLIERASPGPYLELFARRQAPGWTCWGDALSPPELTAEPSCRDGKCHLGGCKGVGHCLAPDPAKAPQAPDPMTVAGAARLARRPTQPHP